MANAASATILEDGPRYTVVQFNYTIDTSDLAETVVADPLAQYIDTTNTPQLANYAIDEAMWSIQNAAIGLRLQWKATAKIDALVCAGAVDNQDYPAPIKNTAGAGKNGQLVAITTGWAAGMVVSGHVVLRLVKVT